MFEQSERPVLGLNVFRVNDLAAACGVTRQTIFNWQKLGFIKPSLRDAGRGADSLYTFGDFFTAGLVARLKEQDCRVTNDALWEACELLRGTPITAFDNPTLVIQDKTGKVQEARIVERAVAKRLDRMGLAAVCFDISREAGLIKKALLARYRADFGE